MIATNKETLVKIATSMKMSAECVLARFKENLEGDPVYTFERSSSAFTAAAKIAVARTVLVCAEKIEGVSNEQEIIDSIRRTFLQDVIHGARWPLHSSSSQSNEMAMAMVAAKAEFISMMDGGL